MHCHKAVIVNGVLVMFSFRVSLYAKSSLHVLLSSICESRCCIFFDVSHLLFDTFAKGFYVVLCV